MESGSFTIYAARSSRDLVLSGKVFVESTVQLPKKFHRNSTFGDLMADGRGAAIVKEMMSQTAFGSSEDAENESLGEGTSNMMEAMMRDMPLRTMVSFSNGAVSDEKLEEILKQLNG